MFHAIRLAKVVYISLLAFSTRPLLPLPLPVERSYYTTNMNQVNIPKNKNLTRAQHRYNQRRASAIADYLLLAAPLQHMQAARFVDELQQKYPWKKDVRKTYEFRMWQRTQLTTSSSKPTHTATNNGKTPSTTTNSGKSVCTTINSAKTMGKVTNNQQWDTQKSVNTRKEMVLNIQLLNTSQTNETQTSTQQPPAMPGPEGDQATSIFDHIPNHVMNNMLKEINEDPALKSILDQFDLYQEEVVDQGSCLEDIDIDIDELFSY